MRIKQNKIYYHFQHNLLPYFVRNIKKTPTVVCINKQATTTEPNDKVKFNFWSIQNILKFIREFLDAEN